MSATCAHADCHCDTDDDFCGAHCAEATRLGHKGVTCECGHIACEEATMRKGGVRTQGSRPV
jgi:hypothetical protein